MATVNKRTGKLYSTVINGVDAGGAMQAQLSEGYDNIMLSAPDGLQIPVIEREVQFCRGSITSQDWVEFINLINGTLGTCAFSTRNRGVAAATGYTDHVITNPVIHRAVMNFTKGQYATVAYDFECKAADETKGFADMHTHTDGQAAPSYISAALGGYRIETAKHDPSGDAELQFYHVMSFQFSLALQLIMAANDADVGYTCVDRDLDNIMASGSITIQDQSEDGSASMAQQLLAADAANLELVLTQGAGAADKTVTIANVIFTNIRDAYGGPINASTLDFQLANDPDTPLTLTGDNKIITIA